MAASESYQQKSPPNIGARSESGCGRILFQNGSATEEFDSSAPSLDEICFASAKFGASIVATARYVVETSKRPIAVALAHVNPHRGLGPTHVYPSPRFEAAFGWRTGPAPKDEIRTALRGAHKGDQQSWIVKNRRREPMVVNIDRMNTGYAAVVLVIPETRARALTRKLLPGATGDVVTPSE